jgi:outer membrane protein TolC
MLAARDDYAVAVRDGRPAAREALEKLAAGYRAGRFTYLDFVEGQRAELEVELSALDAVREYWSARFALEWGAGTSLLPADVHITPEGPR